jgi:hypothetical protein
MRRPATPQELRFPIAPGAVLATLAAVVAGLTVLSVASIIYKFEIEPGPHRELMRIANLDEEGGLQSWYQSSTLLLCGVLMFLIALVRRRDGLAYVRHWAILGAIFACLAIDEAAKLHELTISPLQDRLDAGGVLYYTWIVPAALILLVLGAAYLRFLRDLAPRTRALFLTAAALYIGGGMGFEAANGLYVDRHGTDTLVYALLTNVEEVLEMTGVLVLLSALMSELAVPAAVKTSEVPDSDGARAAVAAGRS